MIFINEYFSLLKFISCDFYVQELYSKKYENLYYIRIRTVKNDSKVLKKLDMSLRNCLSIFL